MTLQQPPLLPLLSLLRCSDPPHPSSALLHPPICAPGTVHASQPGWLHAHLSRLETVCGG